MKLKNAFLLLAFTAILFSCQKEETTTVIDTSADLTSNAAVFDNSNYGVYEGTFTTLDSDNRGVVTISLKEDNNGRASLQLLSGRAIKLAATQVYSEGTDTDVVFSGHNVSFRFTVNNDGSNPMVTDVVYTGKDSSIKVLKETTRVPVTPLSGTYEFNGNEDTFNITFGGDGTGDDTALVTSIMANGVDIGTATGNEQSGCVADSPEVGLTSCVITGTTASPFTMNAISWTGTHIYDSGVDGCSQFSGTWTAGGGQSGTFTNDFVCETQPGDVPATAIAIVPNAEGTNCATADQTVDLSANAGYTPSGEAATACNNGTNDVWYSWTAATDGLTFFALNPLDINVPGVAVYTVTPGAFGAPDVITEVGCGDGSFGAISLSGWAIGDDLLIRVSAAIEIPFCVEEFSIPSGAPANDLCIDAEDIACGDTVTGNTVTATNEDGVRGNDVWYTLTDAGAGDDVTISLCGSAYDTHLEIRDACGGALVASNDDDCGAQSELTFTADGTTQYVIRVDGFSAGDSGAYTMTITCSPPPPPVAIVCGGVFEDSGLGAGGGYENNEAINYAFDAGAGMLPVLDFTVFAAEGCCDNMRIFDGVDATAPEFTDLAGAGSAPYNGTELLGVNVTGTSQNLYITWTSDGSVNGGEGWSANATCIPVGPNANNNSGINVARHMTASEVEALNALCAKEQSAKAAAYDKSKRSIK